MALEQPTIRTEDGELRVTVSTVVGPLDGNLDGSSEPEGVEEPGSERAEEIERPQTGE